MKTIKKVIRDGKVAVLYSPGFRFGAGWYTWNRNYPECIFSPEIVALVESDKRDEITDEYAEELFGSDYFYTGGAHDLEIEWLPEGTQFTIYEYDGSESIKLISDLSIIA